jgi:hypothetical protein
MSAGALRATSSWSVSPLKYPGCGRNLAFCWRSSRRVSATTPRARTNSLTTLGHESISMLEWPASRVIAAALRMKPTLSIELIKSRESPLTRRVRKSTDSRAAGRTSTITACTAHRRSTIRTTLARRASGCAANYRHVAHFGSVVGVSLAGPARMRFRPHPPLEAHRTTAFALDLEPRSLYCMQGAALWDWQHAVAATKTLRYAITFRTLADKRTRRGR